MIGKFAAVSLIVVLALSAGVSSAEERRKMELLDPADPPCLFLLDENLDPTGNAMNPPCELGSTIINAGDPINADDRQRFGQAAPTSGETSGTVEATSSPREAASGMPTGRR